MTAPCPHCQREHDLSTRQSYDELWCPGCDHWLLVLFLNDRKVLLLPLYVVERGRYE